MKARENPFSSSRVESLAYRPTGIELPEIMKCLKDLKYRAAVVGPKGSGKTTLTNELGNRLSIEGFRVKNLLLTAEKPNFPGGFLKNFFYDLSEKDAVLFDGAEQMPRIKWQMLRFRMQKSGAFIITSHVHGLLPELMSTGTTPELLQELVLELLGKESMIREPEIKRLFLSHKGDIRLALRELYDIWAMR